MMAKQTSTSKRAGRGFITVPPDNDGLYALKWFEVTTDIGINPVFVGGPFETEEAAQAALATISEVGGYVEERTAYFTLNHAEDSARESSLRNRLTTRMYGGAATALA